MEKPWYIVTAKNPPGIHQWKHETLESAICCAQRLASASVGEDVHVSIVVRSFEWYLRETEFFAAEAGHATD